MKIDSKDINSVEELPKDMEKAAIARAKVFVKNALSKKTKKKVKKVVAKVPKPATIRAKVVAKVKKVVTKKKKRK